MLRRALLLCPVAALALTGCGGSDHDDLASCLVGTWDGNPSEMEPELARLLSEDGSVSLTVSGSQVQTFQADGTYHLAVDIAIDLASDGPGGDVFEQGTAEGAWTVEGDRLTLTYTSTAITLWSAAGSVASTMRDGTYRVTCSATTLTSTVPDDTPGSSRTVSYTSQRR